MYKQCDKTKIPMSKIFEIFFRVEHKQRTQVCLFKTSKYNEGTIILAKI